MKKYTTKSSNKIRYLFFTIGPGETSQARALAKYISRRDGEIIFSLQQRVNLFFVAKDKEFKVFVTETPLKLKGLIEKKKPDVLLFFNSKGWSNYKGFIKKPPFQKPSISLAVDSNWLFNNKIYKKLRFSEWMDKYLITMPQKIFRLGLKENGGNFKIPPEDLKKIIPIGFLPSFKKVNLKKQLKLKYKIKKSEKLIFAYLSGYGAEHKTWVFDNLVDSVDRLIKGGKKIRVIYVGPKKSLNPEKTKRKWLIFKEKLPAEEFSLTLASSDLIFQHQGLATLSQGISAQIPIIANATRYKKSSLPNIHFWEVRPFERAGVCFLLSKSSSIKKISKKIEELLYNPEVRKKMQKNQKAVLEKGEERSFQVIKELIENN